MSRRSHRPDCFSLLLLAVLASGCAAPTLSKPRGAAHLSALAEAESHQHAGRYAEASEAYLHAAESAERRVDRDESLYRQSRVLARAGDLAQAIAILDQLGASQTIARRTLRARLDAARYRLQLEDAAQIERAEHDLRTLVEEHPESGAARGALRVLVQRHVDSVESDEQALAYTHALRAELDRSPLAEVLMSLEAGLLVRLDRKDEARTLLEELVARYPYPQGSHWDEALWQLADLALERGEPQQAIAHLKQMVAANESSFVLGSYTRALFPKAALRIARIYRDELDDAEAAIDAYADVRGEFPRSLVCDDALAEEAELRIARGQRGRGCALLEELVRTHEVGSARRRAETRLASDCR